MWFRQNQPMDTDRIRESLKNQMRRFRSSDASATVMPVTPPTGATIGADVVDFRRLASEIHCDAGDVVGGIAIGDCDPCLLAVMRSPSGRKLAKQLDGGGGGSGSNKDGKPASPLAADTKFKSKQRTKAKLVELDKNRCASRKTSAPPGLDNTQIAKTGGGRKHVRSHSNLNFNALLRYKLTNRVLATVDSDSGRRKSVSGESFLAGLVRGKDALRAQKSVHSYDEPTSSDNGDGDDDGGDASDADASVARLPVPTVCAEHKKSPSLGARVAAHFGSSGADSSGGGSSARTKLSKMKKHRHNSRITGLYTQNSFGNYGRGERGRGHCIPL